MRRNDDCNLWSTYNFLLLFMGCCVLLGTITGYMRFSKLFIPYG